MHARPDLPVQKGFVRGVRVRQIAGGMRERNACGLRSSRGQTFSRCVNGVTEGRREKAFQRGVAATSYWLSGSKPRIDRKSTRLNSSHLVISYAVFCLKKKKKRRTSIVKYSLKSEAVSTRH